MESYRCSLAQNKGEGKDALLEVDPSLSTFCSAVINDCWFVYLQKQEDLPTTETLLEPDKPVEPSDLAFAYETAGCHYWRIYLEGEELESLDYASHYYALAIKHGSKKVELFFQRFSAKDYTPDTLKNILSPLYVYTYLDPQWLFEALSITHPTF